MSFGNTSQNADKAYKNLTVSETLAVKGRLTAGIIDGGDVLLESLSVNGNILAGGTGTFLGGVIAPSISAVTGGVLTVPAVTGTLVVNDSVNGWIQAGSLTVHGVAAGNSDNWVAIDINGTSYKLLLHS